MLILEKFFQKSTGKTLVNLRQVRVLEKKRSDETKLKISVALKGRVMSSEQAKNNGLSHKKPVINIDTGEIFDSAKDAEIYYGVAHGAVSHVCRGNHKTCLGYVWKYVDK